MSTKCIEVHNLTKSFHGRRVVYDLSFTVEKGQVFGLLSLAKSPVMKLSGGERQKLQGLQ